MALSKKTLDKPDETRPFLQGSRLTAWELMKDGIPTTLISDNMAGHIMSQGKIQAVIVDQRRIGLRWHHARVFGNDLIEEVAVFGATKVAERIRTM